jgi:hypothetical protein
MSKGGQLTSKDLVKIITAVIAAIGAITAAYFVFLGNKVPVEMEISATQTAESKRATLFPIEFTQTAESTPVSLVLVPTPTAWPLGDQTSTDPIPLCKIAVSNFSEPGRERAKRLQYDITGKDGFCSWIIPLKGFNATSIKQITFWIKGEVGGEAYDIGVKDQATQPGKEHKVSRVATPSWAKVSIPIEEFKIQNLSSLENFSLTFKSGSGTVYVDQLIFGP